MFAQTVDYMAFNNTLQLLNGTFVAPDQAPAEVLGAVAAENFNSSSWDFSGVIDMFYNDEEAQNFTKTFLNDAQDAFDIDQDSADKVMQLATD